MNQEVSSVVKEGLPSRFISFALAQKAFLFGAFTTKAGRQSPYFFNAGIFDDGAALARLGQFYAERLLAQKGLDFDMLFGPAYKGISLASTAAIALSQSGKKVTFAFNRKEAKDHGEGGNLIGAPLKGKKVVIIDDVISAGLSVKESVALIERAGAQVVAVAVAFDRNETIQDNPNQTALQAVEERYQIPVVAIATVEDLLPHISTDDSAAIKSYLAQYGVA